MKIQLDETYESWASRVTAHEKQLAVKQLAKGVSIDLVLEEMSRRVTEKLMHPILMAIKDSVVTEHVPVLGQIGSKPPTGVADHVDN